MIDRTLLIWAIPAACTLIFTIIAGWANIHVPYKVNDEATIHKSQKFIVKERFEMWKISTIFTVATVITTGLFLYWCFFTTRLSFNSFSSGASAVVVIVLVILSIAIIIAFLNFVYVLSGSAHESVIKRRYSKFYEEDLIITHG